MPDSVASFSLCGQVTFARHTKLQKLSLTYSAGQQEKEKAERTQKITLSSNHKVRHLRRQPGATSMTIGHGPRKRSLTNFIKRQYLWRSLDILKLFAGEGAR